MEIITMQVEDLKPYERNARRHDIEDVGVIAKSIEKYGFNDPIGIWGNKNIVVEGHGRLLAAKKLGLNEVPVIRLDHLTDQQRREYAIMHNKTAELSAWDFQTLEKELKEIDFTNFDISFSVSSSLRQSESRTENQKSEEWFDDEKQHASDRTGEESQEYQEFLEKFEPKKTTDDCYTPALVYDAVADYVSKHYGLDKSKFVRPFYPGGDYQKFNYSPDSVVVDNPPFSIESEICKFYTSKGIKFFLFSPANTTFNTTVSSGACAICVGVNIIYENKANVPTSFVTNLESARCRTAPDLYKSVTEANKENLKEQKKNLPKYLFPDYVVTAAMLQRYSRYSVEYSISKEESERISELESMKKQGKAIFGGGFIVSERAAAERAAAHKWELSEEEMEIVRKLSHE